METNVDSQVDAAIDAIENGIDAALRSVERRQQNEAAGIADIAGIIVSTPFIIQVVGSGLKMAQNFIQKNANDKKTVGDYMIKLADKMHHVLLKPFELLAATFTSDKHKQHAFAEIMMSGLIFVLLLNSGLAALEYAKKLNLNQSIVYTLKSGVKGAELRQLIPKIIDVAKSEIGILAKR